MTKKIDPVDHVAGEFQLDRTAMGIDAGLANGIIDKVFSELDNMDLNHDHKSDIAEIAPVVLKTYATLVKIAPAIDTAQLQTWLLAQGWVKDKALATTAIADIEALVTAAAKLAPAAV